eukprot:CAMPEP_0119570904 /NCGR_PEP_ID=MMETSP1352-20130426/43850_1 /TAXON_ID=265584 /ORGANISM="Stauroneis constricta, Strain CCMP1120" /LENGTH=462 /DNA_ID=CAMNT_0007620581 /DNA_START=511 /DNA_END=1899 /DNA_ORIENTATION=-
MIMQHANATWRPSLLAFIAFILSLLAMHSHVVVASPQDRCDLAVSLYRGDIRPPGYAVTFDDATELGLENIHKIVRIQLKFRKYQGFVILSEMSVWYLLQRTGLVTMVQHGAGGSVGLDLTLKDDEFITRMEVHTGKYIDNVMICLNTGACTHRAGSQNQQNRYVFDDRSSGGVIGAFYGRTGDIVDSIGVHYYRNKLVALNVHAMEYNAAHDPLVKTRQLMGRPSAIMVLDNTGGERDQTTSMSFEETLETFEVATNSKTVQTNITIGVYAKVSVLFGVGIGTAGFEFEFGRSVTDSFTETKSKRYTYTMTQDFPLVAAPGTRVTAIAYIDKIEYKYTWDAEVSCLYANHRPSDGSDNEWYPVPDEMYGDVDGVQLFPSSYVIINTVLSNSTLAPSQLLTATRTPPAPTPTRPPRSAPTYTEPRPVSSSTYPGVSSSGAPTNHHRSRATAVALPIIIAMAF